MSRIPVLDLSQQINNLWDELNAASQRVLRSGHFILGPEVQAFERECSEFLGVKHAVGLNSGTDALFIALRAAEIGPGDEVITTPFTFFATAEAISHVGATPVFVDIEHESLNLDVEKLERAITARTKAIIPVHVFGRPCRLNSILELAQARRLLVIEDCAQSFGAQISEEGPVAGRFTGAIGTMNAFSFFPSKNLGAFGDGGLLTTNDDTLAGQARMLRAHGSRKKYHNEAIGYNSRLDEIQAAFLRVKLKHLRSWNTLRRQAASRYAELLAAIPGVSAPSVTPGHVFHQYTVRIGGGRREAVRARLAELGVETMVYYPIPCHRLGPYTKSHATVKCPVAEAACDEVLSLPIWPEMTQAIQERVVGQLAQALK